MASRSNSAPHDAQTMVEAALCVALAVLLLWRAVLPAWHVLNTDFPNYYLVARLLREGYSLDRVYDWIWLQRVKDHWGIDQSLVGFAGLTPSSALPLVPLTVFTAMTAKRIWIVLNFAFLACTAELLHRDTSLGRRRVWIICLLAIVPLRTSFLYGQMHLLVLLLMVLAFSCYTRRRMIACGALLALAAALKIYPAVFGIYFLWKKQWRPLLGLIVTAVVVMSITCMWMGPGIVYQYISQQLPRSLQGEMLDPYHWHAASAAALLHRLLLFEPALNPHPLYNSPALYAILYPLWQLAVLVPFFSLVKYTSNHPRSIQLEWAALTIALLVLSPVPSSYHFVVMILPVVLLVEALKEKRRSIVTILALYVMISVTDLWSPAHPSQLYIALVGFSRLWISLALYAICLHALWREAASTHLSRRRIYSLTAAALVVAVVGVAGYRQHFILHDQQMGRRLQPASENYLAIAPQPLTNSYLFVAMTPHGYRIFDKREKQSRLANTDQLSFAASPAGYAMFAELAERGHSRIVRADDATTVAEDAESPAISNDGRSLLFLREDKGRGSLWVVPIDHADRTATPTRLTDDSYDVRFAAWLGEDPIFAAKHDGHIRLFKLGSREPTIPFASSTDIGSFAVSADHSRIALTTLIHNRWQLAVLRLSDNRTAMLTSGDCNAYTPSWIDSSTILYGTDCGRGLGLTALASVNVSK